MLSDSEREGIVAHMNADHADALVLYVRAFGGLPAADRARLVAVDENALTIEAAAGDERRTVRLAFPAPVETPGQARKLLIEWAAQARAALGQSG